MRKHPPTKRVRNDRRRRRDLEQDGSEELFDTPELEDWMTAGSK